VLLFTLLLHCITNILRQNNSGQLVQLRGKLTKFFFRKASVKRRGYIDPDSELFLFVKQLELQGPINCKAYAIKDTWHSPIP